MQKLTRRLITAISIFGVAVGSVLLLGASTASADRQVSAVQVVVLSDDIRKGEAHVLHASDIEMDMGEGEAGGDGSDDSASGGDGTGDSGGGSETTGDDSGSSDGDGGMTDDDSGTTSGGTSGSTSGGGNDNNRSGLGDGTNPGQGGGTENATNEGTDNPHHVRHTGRSHGRSR